jgi:hypothetical protein
MTPPFPKVRNKVPAVIAFFIFNLDNLWSLVNMKYNMMMAAEASKNLIAAAKKGGISAINILLHI